MSEISHIDTPIVILKIKDLCGHQKYLLTLIVRFTKKGECLKMRNPVIADLLGICEKTGGRLLKDMADKHYIRIENPKTKHRRGYLLENEKTMEIRKDKVWTFDNILLKQVVPVERDSTETNMEQNGGLLKQVVPVHSKDKTKDNIKTEKSKYTESSFSKKQAPSSSRFSNNLQANFDRFWVAYPKKVDKQQAWGYWQKLQPDEELVSVIMSALENHKLQPQWNKDNGDFIISPYRWLKRSKWEDMINTIQPEFIPLQRGKDGLTPYERQMQQVEQEREKSLKME